MCAPRFPVKQGDVADVAREVPRNLCRLSSSLVVGALLCFAVPFIQTFFILNAVWRMEYYYVFGFLLLTLVLLALTAGEAAVLATYFQLRGEDHRWWWRSVVTPAGGGVLLFVYTVTFYQTRLSFVDVDSVVVYFIVSAAASVAFALLCGAVGYQATLMYMKALYGSTTRSSGT